MKDIIFIAGFVAVLVFMVVLIVLSTKQDDDNDDNDGSGGNGGIRPGDRSGASFSRIGSIGSIR